MNTRPKIHPQGFASLDLAALVIAVVIVVAISFAYLRQRAMIKAKRISCVSNQKCIGLSFRLWAGDNSDKFPALLSVTNGGALEMTGQGAVYPIFALMSNELSTPKLLLCPVDFTRTVAINFTALRDTNISYFVNLDADETQPQGLLIGDRNLATNNVPLKPGLTTIHTNTMVSWTADLHRSQGNIVLADGSVQQVSNSNLLNTVREAFPVNSDVGVTNWSFRLAIP